MLSLGCLHFSAAMFIVYCLCLLFVPSVFAIVVQAEEITLAIGQAFDLAYKKFLESGGKDVETRKQIGNLQKRVGVQQT